ncbi:S9 family peptidase [Phenylobacterium montanum]|uniref:S9 family peptidase n=1 Tax=Phenylobacterium montanum TaxID=2823693 RepID=A0A975IVE0_9CAUL|nr:prolyl oligopeptidase family serine peptidase [Caulobacter sp. S6]QUD88907.1 S9 family peptidase [Caulobacter sp. S6]
MRTLMATCAAAALALAAGSGAASAADFTMPQALSYPFVNELAAAAKADRIAWVRNVKGVRNVWVAEGPAYAPRQVSQFTEDDGQELTQLTFSPDGKLLVFVRGGDHDENWPAKGDLQPNPNSSPTEPKITLWAADPTGAKPAQKLVEGDAPAISPKGVLAYVKDGQVWTAALDGKDGHRLFFDRGKDGALAWSPDGSRLAFVSNREDHAFIGVYADNDHPIAWMAPSTGADGAPVWSPDGQHIAFTRQPGDGGAPQPLLKNSPHPWSIWTADLATGQGRALWRSDKTLRASYPDVAGEANLHWAAEGQLTFLSLQDNWPHLYAVPAAGGAARLLTPGAFMVEHVALSQDGKALVYSANTGSAKDDDDRRHLFRVSVAGGAPTALTSGEGLEWRPVATSAGAAFISAGPRQAPAVEVVDDKGSGRRLLDSQAAPADFAGPAFVVPRQVSFTAPDGLTIHGQLFEAPGGAAKKPGVIFVHGGPPRQMMLGWSYMDYYSNAYAVNQYLAAHGFVVLSVNYRLGIGYGYDFQHPEGWGPTGAAEYQDVVAGARFLQARGEVDPAKIGIWGGSYGGYLTGLALARNSDLFKAGVDLHGVHDWSRDVAEELGPPLGRYEQGDRAEAIALAFKSSPDADVDHWTSPVLLIQGDDDRNVRFNQTIDLARRLDARGAPYEELVLPDEIHGFLRYADWLKADQATAEFLARKLGAGG